MARKQSDQAEGGINMLKSIAKRSALPVILLIVAVLFPIVVHNNYYIQICCTSMIYLVAVYGLNFITGMTGQTNIGTAGIFALGAYTSALFETVLGWNAWLSLIPVIAMGVIIGFGLGFPSLRLQGIYLALTTIALTEIVRKVILAWSSLTQGALGIKQIPNISIFGLEIKTTTQYYYFALVIIVILSIICSRIIKGKWGRIMIAVKDNPEAASTCGANIVTIKLTAFVIAAILGCLAGWMFCHNYNYVNPSTFTMDMSINFVIMMSLGGAGNIYGCMLGALAITLLPELLRVFGEYYQIIYALIVVTFAVFLPGGITSLIKRGIDFLKVKLRKNAQATK